jgi:hypothetical protein
VSLINIKPICLYGFNRFFSIEMVVLMCMCMGLIGVFHIEKMGLIDHRYLGEEGRGGVVVGLPDLHTYTHIHTYIHTYIYGYL